MSPPTCTPKQVSKRPVGPVLGEAQEPQARILPSWVALDIMTWYQCPAKEYAVVGSPHLVLGGAFDLHKRSCYYEMNEQNYDYRLKVV